MMSEQMLALWTGSAAKGFQKKDAKVSPLENSLDEGSSRRDPLGVEDDTVPQLVA
jgi:hypothetical protein